MKDLSNVHIVAVSDNPKTGPIPQTYRPMDTCPTSCPFLPTGPIGGCYGTGRLFSSAAKWAGKSGVQTVEDATWKVRLGKYKSVKLMRDRVVGDVLNAEGTLDRDYIEGIAAVARGAKLTVFGYTHAWRDFTAEDVAFIADTGYVMNASCETEGDVLRALELGLPAVLVNEDLPDGTMIGGARLVTCPEEIRDDVQCMTCGLCAKPNRTSIVRFTPHGNVQARTRRAIAAAQEIGEEAAA